LKGELSFCICPQTLTEFFAIVTDSKRVSKPRTQKEALEEIEKYLSSKTILKIYPGPEVIETMINLLKKYKLTKQKIFDLQLVATILSNNVTQIYTYNKGDFSKFKEITVLSP
jgi:predicted nucleic acid-binding protein